MDFPERFSNLPEYAFPRLRALLDHHDPGGEPILMTIGDPQHAPPDFVADIIARHVDAFRSYPPNDGTPTLRAAIAGYLNRRYGVTCDPDTEIFPLNGTREGLFNAGIALSPETKNGKPPVILMPAPFYQVYAVSSITAGAEPVFVPATAETGFLPDFAALPAEILDRTTICYICSPSNPQGAIADHAYWQDLLALAERHDFRIFADECYAEIYRDTPPPGILETAKDRGRVLAFHSLSKRSNLAGLRSGFVAGDAASIAELKKLRAYGGAPLPLPLQHVAEACWRDDHHVDTNRAQYRAKYDLADRVFDEFPGYIAPEAGFFLWLPVPDGETMALRLWQETGTRVLPGAYLSRSINGTDPGAGYIRVALVADLDTTERGLRAIRATLAQ